MPEITQRVFVRMVTVVDRQPGDGGRTKYATTEDLQIPTGTTFYIGESGPASAELIFEQDLEIAPAPEEETDEAPR